MYVSTDVATEQNVTVEQSIVTDPNTVADQNIQNNSYGYELDSKVTALNKLMVNKGVSKSRFLYFFVKI